MNGARSVTQYHCVKIQQISRLQTKPEISLDDSFIIRKKINELDRLAHI